MDNVDLSKVFIKTISDNDKISSNYLNTIKTYDSQEFEDFIYEWIKFCRYKDKQINAYNIGGTGDHGIDIMVRYNNEEEVYQCKKYASRLNESEVAQIITKVLWYYFVDFCGRKYPSTIHIAALSNYSINAARMLDDENILKREIKSRVLNSLKSENITSDEEQLETFKKYLEKFNYKTVKKMDINEIILEYSRSEIAFSRFRNVSIKITRRNATEIIKKLPNIYQQQIKNILSKTKLSQEQQKDYLKIAEADFYSAVSLRETCYYFLGDTREFEKIENDVLSYINVKKFDRFNSDFERMQSILEKANTVITSDSYLDYCIHLVSNEDRKGACHWLVNNAKFNWES